MDVSIGTFEEFRTKGKLFIYCEGYDIIMIDGLRNIKKRWTLPAGGYGSAGSSGSNKLNSGWTIYFYNGNVGQTSWYFETEQQRDKIFNKIIDLFAIRITLD
jgi:hypothetical protein